MPVSQPTFPPKVRTGATNVEITNLSLPIAATEVSHLLQDNLKSVIIRSRTRAKLQVAFVSTESGTKYFTLRKDAVLTLSDVEFTSKTIYLQSDVATTVEILELYN